MNELTAQLLRVTAVCAVVFGAIYISKDPDYLWGLFALVLVG